MSFRSPVITRKCSGAAYSIHLSRVVKAMASRSTQPVKFRISTKQNRLSRLSASTASGSAGLTVTPCNRS